MFSRYFFKPSVRACLDSHFKAGLYSSDAPRKEEKKNRTHGTQIPTTKLHQEANTLSLEVPKKVWHVEVPLPGAITSSSRSIPESGFLFPSGASIFIKCCQMGQQREASVLPTSWPSTVFAALLVAGGRAFLCRGALVLCLQHCSSDH